MATAVIVQARHAKNTLVVDDNFIYPLPCSKRLKVT